MQTRSRTTPARTCLRTHAHENINVHTHIQVGVGEFATDFEIALTVNLRNTNGTFFEPEPFGGSNLIRLIAYQIVNNPDLFREYQEDSGCCGYHFPGDWFSCKSNSPGDMQNLAPVTDDDKLNIAVAEEGWHMCIQAPAKCVDTPCAELINKEADFMLFAARNGILCAWAAMIVGQTATYLLLNRVNEKPRKE